MKIIKWLFTDWDKDKILLVFLLVSLILFYGHLIPQEYTDGFLLVVSVIGTVPVLFSAFKSLREKKISVDLLASIALVASLVTKEWASAVFINLMLTSARIFDTYTEGRARSALQSLLKLKPQVVRIRQNDKVTEIPTDQVRVGDIVLIEIGERVPVDGEIIEGAAEIDQSSLTGESVPVPKKKGDEVLSSTLVVAGSLVIKAVRVGEDTTLQKIINLVDNSQKTKAKIRTLGETFASWYIGITLIGSIVVYIIFKDLNLLLSLLLVACADDIAIAVPLAFLAAIGYAAHRGVIVKGGAYLEGFTKVKTIVADKTGTLTTGKMKVAEVVAFKGYTKEQVAGYSATASSLSDHPISKAIVGYADENKIKYSEPKDVDEVAGKGLAAKYKNVLILSGNKELFAQHGVKISAQEEKVIDSYRDKGLTITRVAYGKKVAGFIATSDTVRPNVKAVVEQMRALGVEKWVMLTGDNEKVAERVADELGFDKYYANLMPEDKINHLKQYISEGEGKVAMIGDGVNDAASLAMADVGVAMGAIGSDAAIEAADIALMRDDLLEVPEVMKLGKFTVQVARQDFWIWGLVNAFGLVLVFGGVIGPVGAAAYNFVTDFFPLFNSMRLFNLHLQLKRKQRAVT